MDKPYLCKGCGAPCKWIKMLRTGKNMIVDLEPEHRVMILEDLPEGTTSNFQTHFGEMVKVYKQHWASCTAPLGGFRKKGERDAPRQHRETDKDRQQSLTPRKREND